MGLVTSTEMFKKAYEGHYAIGAFNVNNMEIIQGITEAATMEKAPVILQVSKGARAYAKHVYLVKLVEAALLDAQESGVDLPIVLHGASSVMPEYVQMINQYGGNIPGAQGVPEEMLRQAASMAVCKINVDSDLRLAMTGVIRKQFAEHPDQFDPRQYLKPARIALRDMVRHKIVNVMGCNGKA